jgi:hypothetical protein
VLAAVASGACSPDAPPPASPEPARYAFVWAGDVDGADTDFLATVDVAEGSPTYGDILATVPVGVTGIMAHHTELQLGSQGFFFANAYAGDRTWVFDVNAPTAPAIVRELAPIEGYQHIHSFWRHPDGRVLATVQFSDSTNPGRPGGLAEFSATGEFVRVTSSADPAFPEAAIRTYALDASVAADVVVTTSAPMDDERGTADVVQIWRLADLTLRHTLPFPAAPDSAHVQPFEVKVIGDGDQALVNTWYCGLYLVDGLIGDALTVEQVMVFGSPRAEGCSVPAVIGHYWIMPVALDHYISVVDIADPRAPREVSRLETDDSFYPHWVSVDPGSDRLVFSLGGGEPHGIRIARFDRTAGALTWDAEALPDITFDRSSWPHGDTGPASPHGVVFGH